MSRPTDFGETWTYESIVGALPGIEVSTTLALAIQLGVFEAGVVVLAWFYDLWDLVFVGSAAVFVAGIGSIEMVRVARRIRSVDLPDAYRRLVFGSNMDVLLAVLAFCAMLTYLFVPNPASDRAPLLDRLLGPDPPVLVVYFLLLVLWDVCYRIGTGWWATVTALWRSYRYRFDADTAHTFFWADVETIAFGVIQLLLVPFVLDYPVLLAVLLAHVSAVLVVTSASLWLLHTKRRAVEDATAT
ncbi:DUF7530 family protein [Halococcus saccharolyticus]|uniref:Uncharacterized protein n=1 Tax=Halococcus saccharolyticus DSM 5350 TaxID=1227455 RepID=M0MAN9_9EURY|nr:hypothetical protein [Halococcus saccharolyticus]EMA42816.1 hypothetical protein C449_16778 [Halococcus saccharolyticus DSM 5350]